MRSNVFHLARFCALPMLGAAFVGFVVLTSGAHAAEPVRQSSSAPSQIVVMLNQAKVIQLPEGASTVIVGNPMIADVTLLRNTKNMILTAKGFGETNLIALDGQGRSVGESMLRVTAPTSGLVVQRGLERETWDCTPRCQPTLMLGDSTKFATEAVGQIQLRNGATATR